MQDLRMDRRLGVEIRVGLIRRALSNLGIGLAVLAALPPLIIWFLGR